MILLPSPYLLFGVVLVLSGSWHFVPFYFSFFLIFCLLIKSEWFWDIWYSIKVEVLGYCKWKDKHLGLFLGKIQTKMICDPSDLSNINLLSTKVFEVLKTSSFVEFCVKKISEVSIHQWTEMLNGYLNHSNVKQIICNYIT